MENQTNSNQDCGCGEGCCTPKKKSNLWKRVLSIIIILAAGAIITVKLVGKQDTPPEKCCDTKETPACCPQTEQDSTEVKCCNAIGNSFCCPQTTTEQ